jgi:hypothetical protein
MAGYSYYLTVTNTSPNAENFSFTMSLPADLSPFAFTAPTSVTANAPNPSIQLVWGVTNQGSASASGWWYDTVWFSTDGVLDANSIDLGNFWVNQTVPVGGSYWQTNNVTLPMNASGNYTLFVQVDAGNYIYEANLGDKVSTPGSSTFTLTPPDLMPVWVVAPATVTATQPNPAIQVAWGVTNQGIGPATGGWYDRVWFSTNGVLDANSIDVGDYYFNQGVLAVGSYSQTNSVTLPISPGGTYNYTLFVQVDIYNWIYELNKSNNISAPVPGTLLLDLPPQIVTQPVGQLVPPGVNVTFSVAAIGTPPLSYQWQLNNTNLTGATNSTLALNNVQPTNTGNVYLVVVTNAFGTATSTGARLLVSAPGTNCVNAPSGLIAWWPGDGNALDIVGGNNGTLMGGVTFTNGEVGQAFSFVGANEAVLIPYFPGSDLGAMPSWTIEAWVNPASFNNSSWPTIYAKGHWDASLGLNSGTGKLESWINNGNQLIGATVVPLGQWSHVALVYDGTNRTFYVNGAFAGAGSAPGINPDSNTSSIGNVVPNESASFNGQIDEVSIYNRALSPNEIAAIYLSGSYGMCEEFTPIILTQPQIQSVPAGSNAVFSVYAIGEQPLYYQWQKNRVDLTDTGNIAGSTNDSLIICNVSSSDAGTYSVIVSNAFGFVTSTGALLAVNVMQNGGFESGNLNGWTQSGNTSATFVSGSSTYAHSGNYGLQAGPSGSLGYISQAIPTVAGQSYLLSFWLNSPGGTPNEFLVNWNGSSLFDQTNIPAVGWTNMQFIVMATGASTVLEFGFRNDPYYFGLDDISVGAILASPLCFNTSAAAMHWIDNCLQLQLDGLDGRCLIIYASTNLVSWTPIYTNPTAAGSIQFLDSCATNYPFRFYRAVQQ